MKNFDIPPEDKATVKKILDEFILPRRWQIERNTRRQARFNEREENDVRPILVSPDAGIQETVCAAIPWIAEEPDETPEREFFRLLVDSLRISAMRLMTDDDRIVSVYPAFGCGANLTSLGMEQKREHGHYGGYGPPDPLSREEALNLTLDDVQIRGDFEKRLNFARYVRAITDDQIPILCSYTGGPFTFACGVMGMEFMMLTAAEPDLAHEFLDFCVAATSKLLMWLREAGGADDEENTMLGSGTVCAGPRKMQMDIDEAVMFSPAAIDEFVIPSALAFAETCGLELQRVHYCRWYEAFSRALAEEPSIATFNNNPVPDKDPPPFDVLMNICEETDTPYVGRLPLGDGEDPEDYLKRLNKWAKKGLLLPEIQSARLMDGFSAAREIVDYWRRL